MQLARKKERKKEKKHTHTYETKKIATFTFRTKKKQIEKSCQKKSEKSNHEKFKCEFVDQIKTFGCVCGQTMQLKMLQKNKS